MRSPVSLTVNALLLGVLVATALRPAFAAEWYIEPIVRANTRFNDNRTLTPGNHQDTIHKVVRAEAGIGMRNETVSMQLTPRLQSTRVSGEQGLDRDDKFLSASIANVHERFRVSLDLDYANDSVNTSELVPGVNEPEFSTIGREIVRVTPSAGLAIDELTNFSVSGSQSRSWYDANNRTPIKSIQWQGSLTRTISPQGKLTASIARTKTTVPVSTQRTTAKSLQVAYSHEFSDVWSGNASVGRNLNQLHLPFNLGNVDASDPVWGLGLTGTFETMDLVLQYRRSNSPTLSPTGSGFVIQDDTFDASLTRRFSDRLSGHIDFGYLRRQGREPVRTPVFRIIDSEENNADKERYRIGTGAKWDLSPNWSLQGLYAYVLDKRDGRNQDASRNVVSFALSYHGDRFSWSR